MLPKVRGTSPARLVNHSEAGEKTRAKATQHSLPLALPFLILETLWPPGTHSRGGGSLELQRHPGATQAVARERPGIDGLADGPGVCTAHQLSIGVICQAGEKGQGRMSPWAGGGGRNREEERECSSREIEKRAPISFLRIFILYILESA